ncbi:MAG: DUF1570 domain-containing protein [Pirellulaceae bacterium]|nr:DUF1570 domain-containing protein [Pirellulaceae bacterium]
MHNRFVSLVVLLIAAPLAAEDAVVRFTFAGRPVEGQALAWNSRQIFLLARDGQVLELAPAQAENPSRVAGPLRSFSQAEMRGTLLAEFGRGYEVSGVGHYLVVHPAGQRDQWAPRFEQLYRSLVHYFSARGWQLAEPRFPLVAVVFPRHADFAEHAARDGLNAAPGLLGYYSTRTNRILLYDAARSGHDWAAGADTIIHEAAHQAAFNTGVHSRFGVAPRWVCEGLGTMFEARGVWQSRTYPHQSDRINRGRLDDWRSHAASGRRAPETLAQLVSSDRPFATAPISAYAEAWALTFFLCESEPKKYFTYLAKTAAVPPFSDYRSPARLKDFTDVFGNDFAMLDARLARFMAGLK